MTNVGSFIRAGMTVWNGNSEDMASAYGLTGSLILRLRLARFPFVESDRSPRSAAILLPIAFPVSLRVDGLCLAR